MATGRLEVKEFKKGKAVHIVWTNAKGTPRDEPVTAAQLSAELGTLLGDKAKIAHLGGVEVEFDEVQGKPQKIRRLGEAWQQPRPPAPPPRPANQGRGGPPQRPMAGPRPAAPSRPVVGDFRNPYNFIPAPPRPVTGPLADARPCSHDRFHADRFSGTIGVRLTTVTPLLLPDAALMTENADGHKTLPLRVDPDGRPLIPPTSIKGMLRAAFEAATNSRFGVFGNHNERLTYRDGRQRLPHERSPSDLLKDAHNLAPAASLAELSPADRLFGWVAGNDSTTGTVRAYKGNIRIGSVTCHRDDAVERFDGNGLPLAILGQPKPQQSRFYVAKTPTGSAQERGLTTKQAGYSKGKGLRGRKVYPHQAHLGPDHWTRPAEDRTQTPVDGVFQEYHRPENTRDDQNRSVTGWVRMDSLFTFELHVTNLTAEELGALLWLLQQGGSSTRGHFRLGGGKPLGFGSVRLEIGTPSAVDHLACRIANGGSIQESYRSLSRGPSVAFDHLGAINAFQQAVVDAYGDPRTSSHSLVERFEAVPFIAALLISLRGFNDGVPMHYPRARKPGQMKAVPPHPEGEAFEWFVANDRDAANRHTLGDLAGDPGLPMLNSRPKPGKPSRKPKT